MSKKSANKYTSTTIKITATATILVGASWQNLFALRTLGWCIMPLQGPRSRGCDTCRFVPSFTFRCFFCQTKLPNTNIHSALFCPKPHTHTCIWEVPVGGVVADCLCLCLPVSGSVAFSFSSRVLFRKLQAGCRVPPLLGCLRYAGRCSTATVSVKLPPHALEQMVELLAPSVPTFSMPSMPMKTALSDTTMPMESTITEKRPVRLSAPSITTWPT